MFTDDGIDIGTWLLPDERLQGTWSRPDVPVLVFADSTLPPGSATFHGGPIGTGEPVQLIFWGSFWATGRGEERRAMIIDRMTRLIDSPYFSGLAQYGIAPPTYRGADMVLDPEPPRSFEVRMDPVLGLVEDLIDEGRYPDPDDGRIAFLVFMPEGFDAGDANGSHDADYDYDFPFDDDEFWAGWVGFYADSEAEATARTASHELVEMLTDPEPRTGWYVGGDATTGELADGSLSGGVRQTAFVNGAMASSYWSNAHNATIIPIDRDYAARIVGTVSVDEQYLVAEGTFRPDPSDRMGEREPACRFEDRDYTWQVSGQDQTATLEVSVERYRDPRVTWSVAGRPAPVRLVIPISGQRYRGRDLVTETRSVTIDCTTLGNVLEIHTDHSGLNFDLNVTCSVRDGSITGNLATDVIATPGITVGFVGQTLTLDPEYTSKLETCLQALTARYLDDFRTDGRPGRNDGGPRPEEIDATVLSVLPTWVGYAVTDGVADAVRSARIARAVLPADAAGEVERAILRSTPELATALEAGAFRHRA